MPETQTAENTYDYVVVGAGAAGSIVAASLATQYSVALIEAGPHPSDPRIWNPPEWYEVLITDPGIEWGFESVPQAELYCPESDQPTQHPAMRVAPLPPPTRRFTADGRVLSMPQAKVVGGCSLHNAMVYVRGARLDYDRWEELGNQGWGWEGVRPHFEAVETVMGILEGQADPFVEAMISAADESGLPFNPDYNTAPSQTGAALFRYTINSDLARETSFSRFVAPTRGQVTLISAALVTQILICESHIALGVDYVGNGQIQTAYAANEVLLSAGAINSPKLLMLSGIGPALDLEKLGIPVAVDRKSVGESFHDDLFVAVAFSSPQPLPPQPYGLAAVVLFGPRDPFGLIHTECTVSSSALAGMDPPPPLDPGYFIWPNILHLNSTGTVRLQSPDHTKPPRVDPGYLTHPEDLQLCLDGLELGRTVGNAAALAPWRIEEVFPGPHVRTRQQLEEYIRCSAGTTQHYVGSCRMGSDADAVVDPHLRVNGVARLRVIDASVVPSWVTANTAAVSMMIGHKGAELVMATGASIEA